MAVCLAASGPAAAVELATGDVLVTDPTAAVVMRVDPATGTQTIVSSGGLFMSPRGVTLEADRDILIADAEAFGGPGAVIRVDPTTGTQTIVSSGGFFEDPYGIALESDGSILVAEGFDAAVIRVDPTTGAQTIVSSGGVFGNPHGIAVESGGGALVADYSAFGSGAVIRVDPVSGAQTTVSSGGAFTAPHAVAVEAGGDIVVADPAAFGGPGGVIRVDPATGAQTTVSSAGQFDQPFGIAVASAGTILVTDQDAFGGPGAVIAIDPASGAQTTVSSGGSFINPYGIAVVHSLFTFAGFFQPVDNLPTLNELKARAAVAVKFSLGGDQGLDIFAAGYPKSQTIPCNSTAPVDGIESTVAAGSSSLSYNPTLDQYTYVWKTLKDWAGTCRQLVVKLSDGSFHRANFKLR